MPKRMTGAESSRINSSALVRLRMLLDPLCGNSFPWEIIQDCTPCFIRQHYLNVIVPVYLGNSLFSTLRRKGNVIRCTVLNRSISLE